MRSTFGTMSSVDGVASDNNLWKNCPVNKKKDMKIRDRSINNINPSKDKAKKKKRHKENFITGNQEWLKDDIWQHRSQK